MAIVLVSKPSASTSVLCHTICSRLMLSKFCNKLYMKHETHSYTPFVMYNPYDKAEAYWKRTVTFLTLYEVPDGANINASHTVYKVKV